MQSGLEKRYDPQAIEASWAKRWEEERLYGIGEGGGGDYCIVLPPPNVTGTLHMGHAFQTALIDALIRHQRMCGKGTLWQGGVDHAGIATQMVVERLLEAEGSSRRQLGRERFLERLWAWKESSGSAINRQLRRIGCTIHKERERFTMDAGPSAAVRKAFCQLYHDGLIYRGERLANWDPRLQTVVSDLEIEHSDEPGKLYHLRYPLAGQEGSLTVATTRPETMFGDTAVAVHPEDGRYRRLHGQAVALPLCEREIPVIVDEAVERDFGSGCVKITPAHDFNDFEIGQRHKLPMLSVMDRRACLNDKVPARFAGLERAAARAAVVEELSRLGLIERIEDHSLRVPRGDRSHAVLEPMLTRQWFVDATRAGRAALVEPAIAAVRSGEIRFMPDHWQNSYFAWMENLHDWCISRQIWWGHRIPAWYDKDGGVYVAESLEAVRERYGLAQDLELRQDEDVLDTWFSSALWPLSSLDWPQRKDLVQRFYPTSALVTGFDILFFWVARMIMFGLYFGRKPPFRHVYIHGLIRDSHNQKMSKSRGNIIDPLDVIDGIDLDGLLKKRTGNMMQPQMRKSVEKQTRREFPQGIGAYGCDSLRFAFHHLASGGRDIPLDLKRVESGRNFCNKIWNAARFLLMQSDAQPLAAQARAAVSRSLSGEEPLSLSFTHPCNRWMVSRLNHCARESARTLGNYRFDLNAKLLYAFVWESYCDWYLEISKCLASADGGSEETLRESHLCLFAVYERALRLLHPIIPFITEEIHDKLYAPRAQSLGLLAYPEADPQLDDRASEELMGMVCGIISAVRQGRSVRGIAPGRRLPLMLYHPEPARFAPALAHEGLIRHLARLERIEMIDSPHPPSPASLHFFEDLHLLLPLEGGSEVAEERARLEAALANTGKRLESLQKRLSNDNYVANAPTAVVDKDRGEVLRLEGASREISAQIDHARQQASP